MSEYVRPMTPVLSDFAGQGAVYDGLMKTLRDGTHVHAYLISGASGVGKRTLASLIAGYLLCQGQNKPCGACPACAQTAAGNHPDVIVVQPGIPISSEVNAGLKSIPVDEIRAVNALAGRHTFEGGQRVIIIRQAEKMTPGAQNALLKTLEEPMAGTVFLLLTDSPELLLPTIISRCRGLKLHPWTDATVRSVLQQKGVDAHRCEEAVHAAGGSIGRALSVAADEAFWQRRESVLRDFFAVTERSEVLRISGAWKDRKDDAEELLADVEDMIRTLLLVRLGRRERSAVSGFPQPWQRMAEKAEVSAFTALTDAVRQARMYRLNQVTWQAAVERLLLRLMEESNRW
ncbi:MAG: DNA polymerase III subunit delta' [Clostridia bacterium]|nr:DNA polymerase III subunit delta' [Clostridia bacterium]